MTDTVIDEDSYKYKVLFTEFYEEIIETMFLELTRSLKLLI